MHGVVFLMGAFFPCEKVFLFLLDEMNRPTRGFPMVSFMFPDDSVRVYV